jgi:hypothetical protein
MNPNPSKNAIQGKRIGGSPIPQTRPLWINDFLGSVIYFLLSDFSLKVGNGEAYHG